MGRRGSPREEKEQYRRERRSLSGGCAGAVMSLKNVRTSQHMSGRKQTPGPERRPDDARNAYGRAHSSRREAMGRGDGPRERQQ